MALLSAKRTEPSSNLKRTPPKERKKDTGRDAVFLWHVLTKKMPFRNYHFYAFRKENAVDHHYSDINTH